MPVNTAVKNDIDAQSPAPVPPLESVGWRRRHLLSSFSDRRSLRAIGGMSAYLTQVRWSLWWALRR